VSKFLFLYEDPTKPTQVTGSTPYGTYDNDVQFQSESLNVCKYVARKLGHPVMQLEFNSGSIFATFEEAISEYSQQINHYNMKNWMWEHYGSTNRLSGSTYASTGSHEPESAHMGTNFILSEQYGEAVKVGGGLTLHSGSITLSGSKQIYNLETESTISGSHSNKRLEIQRVFNQGPAAITRFYDPFAGSFEQRQMLDSPYKFITYSEINSAGRQWIRKYTLALAKELLGIIRSKYASMPLPNGEVSLDGEALKAEGREEKNAALEELKEFLESVSLTEKTKAEQEQAEAQQQVLNKAPLGIYIA
jgi:hypothetical protein